jgi:histidine kinase
MQQLPPGHSLSGARVPALGGFVQRVRRDSDGRELLARCAGGGFGDTAAVQHLDAEFGASSPDDEAPRPSSRVDGQRESWLLYDAIAGHPLDVTSAHDLDEFWEIAEATTLALAAGHRRGRAHGRLDGNCVWWDPGSRRAALLGMVPAEQSHLANQLPRTEDTAPELVLTEPERVSPAADVYALGAIFYRLLSGRPAVASTGNLAFDTAAMPPAPLDPERVPEPLYELIARMLSKSPASRPPNASAVLDELQAVRHGSRPTRPPLAQSIPVVGRSFELELLIERARAAERGSPSVVRVTGEPGVGKSTLLASFIRQVSSPTRIVADAKFEQFHRGRPYGALLAVCGNALSHALAGDELVFASVSERLREADQALLGVLKPEIPELEHLCGKLPDPPAAGPTENENRFKRAFGELLGKLCTEDTPLVLVLDDVQWADRATADLVLELVEVGLPDHLLLVLAYRETAARQSVELAELLRALDATPLVTVGAFGRSETDDLCRLLVPDCDGSDSLAAVLHARSQGNALYCVELLKNFIAGGDLVKVDGRWCYREIGQGLSVLSETVAELIRDRLSRESPATRELLSAASCIGHSFSDALLAVAMGEEPAKLQARLAGAVRSGFLVVAGRGEDYAFCHDRIQQVALELGDEREQRAVWLRLGREYREWAAHDRSALFPCLECLNPVRDALDAEERHALASMNLEGARRARAAIAYGRAIPLVRLYLESDRVSAGERFEATLLLAECLVLAEAAEHRARGRSEGPRASEQALEECAALATTNEQRLTVLYSRLLFCVHNQDYEAGVDVALGALRLLDHPLPKRPWLPRVIASIVLLSARMRRLDPEAIALRADCTTERDLQVFRFLVGLWGPSHWTNQSLNALVCVHLIELTLRCGNGKHSSMACISYAAVCHMQGRFELAVRYARVAEQLAEDHSVYTRAVVRFLRLTFFGAFERAPSEVIRKYDEALKEGIAHGEIVASHIIDGAVTTLPHLGPELSQVRGALKRYQREARAMGAKTSLEMIHLVECWCELLVEGATDAASGAQRTNALHGPVEHRSFAAGRDILRMQIEYLFGNDDGVLRLAGAVEDDVLLKGNPLHKAGYALFVVLASTRRFGKHAPPARKALGFLERLDAVVVAGEASPATFRPSLRLAQGVRVAASDAARAVELLTEAAALAKEKGQGLVRAIALERLAHLHGARGDYALCVERIRDAAQAYRRFGATAKADALVREFPGVDWTHLRPRGVGIQVEGIMRAASAILEATSTDELGPSLLRVIAATAGAMRAFLFVPSEGRLVLVAGCERDRADLSITRTPIAELDPKTLALKPVHRVERSHEAVMLPRDRAKFLDDPYLSEPNAPSALLCVPLLYRGELVAVLYLESNANAEAFSQDQLMLVTLLGKQAAIALTNADNHRLEVEALQSKVNPHFLYNALTVIAELVEHAPGDAEEAVYKLTRLYRYMVEGRATPRVTLDTELNVVRQYLELERARFRAKLNVVWDIDPSAGSLQVPAMLLQPLAENAVNHGVRRKEDGEGTVTLTARLERDVLLLSVRDDGPGWYEGQGGTGFGLSSVRRRLQLLYGNRAELRIVKRGGVAVELRIPV